MVTHLSDCLRVTKSHIKPASETLARAFQDDPLFVYSVPDALERKKKLPYIFEFLIRWGVLYGEVYATSSDLEGVAVWFSSEQAEMTVWRMIRSGGFSFCFKVGKDVISRFVSFANYAFNVHKRHAPLRHWYLSLIGVDREFQGKGYASALMKPMLARIDQEHLPCYLETENERNVPIFQHYGFEVVEADTIPGSDVYNWAMLRKPALIS